MVGFSTDAHSSASRDSDLFLAITITIWMYFLLFSPILAYHFRDGINKAQQRLTTASQLDANRRSVFYRDLQCVLQL